MVNFTAEEDAIIVASHSQKNASELGKKLHRPKSEVLRRIAFLKKSGVIPTLIKLHWADWQDDILLRMLAQGCSLEEIGKATGKTSRQVSKRKNRIGAKRPQADDKKKLNQEKFAENLRIAQAEQAEAVEMMRKRREETKTIKVYCGASPKAEFHTLAEAKKWVKGQIESFPERTKEMYPMYRGMYRVGYG